MAALVISSDVGLHAQSAVGIGLVERVARVFSPELRRIDTKLAEVAGELDGLPELLAGPIASRYGFRSENLLAQDEPQWLKIDLGRSRKIDCLVVVPVHIPMIGARGVGYGFPLRFKIEVAQDPDMKDAVTVVDRTVADVENPGRQPLVFRMEPVAGRYVRFTSTRHFPGNDGFIWALEEIGVLSGNQTVAVNMPVEASSSLELFPNWAAVRINDGMSELGLPVTTEKSPSRGHLSEVTRDTHENKWLHVDLQGEHVLDEIRLVPVEGENFEVMGRRAFPRALIVELAQDPEFEEVVWSEERVLNHPGLPGGCAVVIPVSGHRGRHLRLETKELWGRGELCGFGLAEIQAYAGGKNVALGKPVAVSDAAGPEVAHGWAPEFLVDGFSSRRRLVEWPEYLYFIERRGALERQREHLLSRRDGKVRATGLVLGYGGGGVGAVIAFSWGVMLVRQRTIRRRTLAQLREQIARDLHDDIGSNLGGIVLLSDMGSRHSAENQARQDFAAIKEAAEETSKSMQDIVWLIGRGSMGLRDLVARMRLSAQAILGDKAVSLIVEPQDFRDRVLSLLFRRHVFFAYKETLNNIRRHAAAETVAIRITMDHARLIFSVRDDGVGFDASRASDTGHGLANLARRAARLKGRCEVDSAPGRGTLVEFSAPFKSRST